MRSDTNCKLSFCYANIQTVMQFLKSYEGNFWILDDLFTENQNIVFRPNSASRWCYNLK